MRTVVFLSILLLLNSGIVNSQLAALSNIASLFLTNPNALQTLLQSPEVGATLFNAFDFANNTGNVTGAVGSLLLNQGFNALTSTAATLLFESFSIATLTNNGVTDACQKNVIIFIEELIAGNSWALRMLDASGKLGSDLADGQTKFLGSYEECEGIRAVSYTADGNGGLRERSAFNGKYCSLQFAVPGIPYEITFAGSGYLQVGICMPETCSGTDLEILASMLERAIFNRTVIYTPTGNCQDGRDAVGGAVIIAIIILTILGGLVVIGTIYDAVAVQMKAGDKSEEKNKPVLLTDGVFKISDHKITPEETNDKDQEDAKEADLPDLNRKPDQVPLNGKSETHGYNEKLDPFGLNGKLDKMENGSVIPAKTELDLYAEKNGLERSMLAFSAYTNGLKILDTDLEGQFTVLYGMRFLTMAWVIFCHIHYYARGYDANFANYLYVKKDKQWTFMVIYGDIAVDTFFTISGLMIAYMTLKKLKEVGGPKKFNWLVHYFHRYWRLTPTYMLVLMFGTAVLPYLLFGPLWNHHDVPYMEKCRDNWWTNFLYINNYVKAEERMCMMWSWYLAADMQYFWVSPLLILPLYFNVVVGAIVCILPLIGVIAVTGIISHNHTYLAQLYSVAYLNAPDRDYYKVLYYPSHTRMGPYIIGVLTGYLLYRWKCKCNISKLTNLAGWFVAVGLTAIVVYVRYDDEGAHLFSTIESDIFNATHRTVWAVAVCWIIFSCVTGHGGWINTLLSWEPFIPLGKLTFCAFLINPLVILTFYSSRMVTSYFTDFEVIYLFLANLVFTYGLSFVASLVFEAPMLGLEKIFFGKWRNQITR